jgi:hypothetical protein
MRNVPVIDYSDAKKIIDLIVGKAAEMQKSVVVAVADSHGELIAFARMDGAPVSSVQIAANKAWTAARERKATKEIGEKCGTLSRGMISPTTEITDSWVGVAAYPSGRMALSRAPSQSAGSRRARTSNWQRWRWSLSARRRGRSARLGES